MNCAFLSIPVRLFPLIVGLTAVISAPAIAQDQVLDETLAAPAPILETELVAGPILQAPAATEKIWKSSLNLGANYASGNTNLRNANFGADASRKKGLHLTTLFATWNYAEQKDDTTKAWDLDQRRTAGGAKHQRFFSDKERMFAFVAVDGENNYNQNVELRFTGTVGLGNQIIKREKLKFSIELGAGYFSESSRTDGVPSTEFPTGRAAWDLDWQLTESLQLLNSMKFFFSLEDDKEMYGVADTKLRASFTENMFAQVQWILQWDNTPARDANGARVHSVDHTALLSVGWSF